ncbi:hypothetical protein FACS1894211_00280 [Clostridia bacterium]|nr:hypothetical protein FACS1894211_00280 [Clostridia bacterium]
MVIISAFADEAAESLAGQITALKKHEFKYLDVRAIDGKNIKDLSARECKEYSSVLRDEGISVNCIASPIGKIDVTVDFTAYTDIVKRIFENAKIFGTDKIRVFSFYNAQKEKGRVFDCMNRFVELGRAFGVKLFSENEQGLYAERAVGAAELLENVPGLNNLFDAANYVLTGQNIGEAVELLAEKTEFFHAKDALYTGEIVPVGEGDGKIAETLKNRKGDLFLTLEPHLFEFGGLANLAAHGLKFKNRYDDPASAFDAGAAAFKKLLKAIGE